jgi:hypothetical protein
MESGDVSASNGGELKGTNGKRKNSGGTTPPQATSSKGVSVALELGWTMAVLFGELRPGPPDAGKRLPTEHELPRKQRTKLEIARANSLRDRLGTLLQTEPPVTAIESTRNSNGGSSRGTRAGAQPGRSSRRPPDSFPRELERVNYEILKWLACEGREFSLAYQLGRSLRDTANPPLRTAEVGAAYGDEIRARADEITQEHGETALAAKAPRNDGRPPELTRAEIHKINEEALDQARRDFAAPGAIAAQLSRTRVARLQEWLSTLAPSLPEDSAGIVSASIGRWCDLATTIFDEDSPGSLKRFSRSSGLRSWFRAPSERDVATKLLTCLLDQGDVWLNLLVGTESAEGLLTPEGFVAAGEASLNRTIRIIWRIVIHYRAALVVLALAVVGIFFIAHGIGGAGQAWTEIGAVASALGVTTKGIGSTMAKLSRDAERPIFGLEKIDAMAWAVTTIPEDLKLTGRGVHALRQSGIPGPTPLGRV